MKNEKTTITANNPFAFATEELSTSSAVRRLDYTPVLQEKARAMATELIKTVADKQDAELIAKANQMMDTGSAETLFGLVQDVFGDERIVEASQVLLGCAEDDMPKMLESQRSNRSKAKKAGIRSKMTNCVTYVSAGIAEMLLRQAMGKPYHGTGRTTELDTEALTGDPEALRRRINSLASKKSRLSKLADYDVKARAELDEVEAQLAELRGLRPEKSKTVVAKSVQLKAVREALQSLSAEELDALPEAMRELAKKLG